MVQCDPAHQRKFLQRHEAAVHREMLERRSAIQQVLSFLDRHITTIVFSDASEYEIMLDFRRDEA
jgi:hypothetical protein